MRYNDKVISEIKTNNLKLRDISFSDRKQLISAAIYECAIRGEIEDKMLDIGKWFDKIMDWFAHDLDVLEDDIAELGLE